MMRYLPLVFLSLAACGNPMNLSYDFGRAYILTSQVQADLSRASVAAAQYRLSGVEGAEIRMRVNEQTQMRKEGTPQFEMRQ
jgi:hypothetical protein